MRKSDLIVADPHRRGLLASPGLAGQALKGVYFFAGEQGSNADLYTAHPTDPDDRHWNSDPSSRNRVIKRMKATNANTIVMSYWGNMPQWSPMVIDRGTVEGILDAVDKEGMLILPALESGFDNNHPNLPHWEFSKDFPFVNTTTETAPGLMLRIAKLLALFKGRMHLWAQLYDREGQPRYAINIIHAASDLLSHQEAGSDETFAAAFDLVAKQIQASHGETIGFTLDAIANQRYSAYPDKAGTHLAKTRAVLAIQGFAAEVFSGRVKNSAPGAAPYDNNRDNLYELLQWKQDALQAWIDTGVPVIYDVSNGFDGRFVWQSLGTAFWGDNMNYTDDRWRNGVSLHKRAGIKGLTFNTWNGYTEGYAAVPTQEHGLSVYTWLTDLFEPPPWEYSHMHYINGQRTHRVYGAICEKWIQLGADNSFGIPLTEELPAAGGKKQYFSEDKAIYWSGNTGAFEVHGLIGKTYRELQEAAGVLGVPVSDEQGTTSERVSYFQKGRIDWKPGDTKGRVSLY